MGKAAKAAMGKTVKAVKRFYKGSPKIIRDSVIESAVREGVETAVEAAKVSEAVFWEKQGLKC